MASTTFQPTKLPIKSNAPKFRLKFLLEFFLQDLALGVRLDLCSVCLDFWFNCECEFCECLIKKSTLDSESDE